MIHFHGYIWTLPIFRGRHDCVPQHNSLIVHIPQWFLRRRRPNNPILSGFTSRTLSLRIVTQSHKTFTRIVAHVRKLRSHPACAALCRPHGAHHSMSNFSPLMQHSHRGCHRLHLKSTPKMRASKCPCHIAGEGIDGKHAINAATLMVLQKNSDTNKLKVSVKENHTDYFRLHSLKDMCTPFNIGLQKPTTKSDSAVRKYAVPWHSKNLITAKFSPLCPSTYGRTLTAREQTSKKEPRNTPYANKQLPVALHNWTTLIHADFA